jgi:AraC family transcriptional regulator of adaptative response / DNA-3-methyladenine glycosylase II
MSQTVVAVKTTGIYCRPGGCAAQPNPQNTLGFATAAAAEVAGYRACLKCRPYRAPLHVPWEGTELVCRAVRLILGGALDNSLEVELADRLGVSARHLRRLFVTQLGVTPAGLARSARAHFARRLLDDTDLSITDIAYAAGFGSLRQFNRVCLEIFRAAPSELRSRRRKSDRLAADGGLALRLHFTGLLDWEASIVYLSKQAIPGVEHVSGLVYRRTIVIGGDAGVLELMPGGAGHLILRAHLPHWEELIHVAERARRIANLDLDLAEAQDRLAADSSIGSMVAGSPGVRPPGTWDAFDVGIRTVIAAEIPQVAVNPRLHHLVTQLGQPVAGVAQMGLRRTFPPPHTVALAGDDQLGLPSPLAQKVRAFARAVATGSIRLDGSLGLDELVSTITAIDGIGPRAAHHIALRLGEPDAWPSSMRAADRWRPWRAIVATHIMRT